MSTLTTSPGLKGRALLQRYGLLLAFALLALALAQLSDRFLRVPNLVNVLRQTSINGIISVGMTLVLLSGGIDLSVGSVLALSAIVGADLMKQGVPVPLAVCAALAIGTALGTINGLIITRGHIPPFIATLGMLTVARGLTLMYTQGRPVTGLPEAFRVLGAGAIGPLPMPIVIAALVFAAGSFILARTRWGESIYLLGDNPTAARLADIPNDRIVTLVYALSGLCAALAGLVLIARLDSAQPVLGQGYEFDAIAAVVVGGTSFAGGQGSLGGTLLGALLIETLNNGLNLLNVSSLWEQVVKGVVIALALLFYKHADHRRRRSVGRLGRRVVWRAGRGAGGAAADRVVPGDPDCAGSWSRSGSCQRRAGCLGTPATVCGHAGDDGGGARSDAGVHPGPPDRRSRPTVRLLGHE